VTSKLIFGLIIEKIQYLTLYKRKTSCLNRKILIFESKDKKEEAHVGVMKNIMFNDFDLR